MRFNDVFCGERFALRGDFGPAGRVVFRKVGPTLARDDQGEEHGVDPDREVELLASADLSHAGWVQDRGTWRLVLRWSTPREERPRWRAMAEDAEEDPLAGLVERHLRVQLAAGHHSRGDLEQALALYDELIVEEPEASLLNNRGAVRAAQGDVQAAIDDYGRALELNEGLAQAYSNRGNALTRLGRYDEALADYDRAIALAGDLAPVYCNRGLTRKMLGDAVGSLDDFEEAIRLDAEFAPSYLARGGVRALLGDVRGAVDDLERFLALSPNAPQSDLVTAALGRLRASKESEALEGEAA